MNQIGIGLNKQNGKVVSFGELLLRMSPHTDGSWIDQNQLPVYIGGAETNVATALACWDIPVRLITSLPEHFLGDHVCDYLSQRGIDTSFIQRSGSRIGLYFLRQGADLKHAGVVYDRKFSSFYDLKPGMIDWDAAFEGVSWFNFSAISPAINEHLPAVCLEALNAASVRGITTSIDLNYREKLWRWGKDPATVIPELAARCDVIMGNIWAANTLLDIPLEAGIAEFGSYHSFLAHAHKTSAAIMERFPRCKAVANTFRFEHGETGLEYYATLDAAEDFQVVSPHFLIESVADKIGSGDCFMAGIIYGLYNRLAPKEAVDFATAAAIGKLSEIGDATRQTPADVRSILQSDINAA